MVINNKTCLEKYGPSIFYILFNCPLYISSCPTLMEEQHCDHAIVFDDCSFNMNHSIYSAPLVKNSFLELRASKFASGLFVLGSNKRLSKH